MNATLGEVTAHSAGWTGMAQHMAVQGQLVTLVAAGVLLLILLLVGIFRTSEDGGDPIRAGNLLPVVGLSFGSGQYGVPDQVGETSLPVGVTSLPVGVASERRAVLVLPTTSADLTPAERAALTALRDRIRARDVSLGEAAAQRLSFARWLVEHGRLEG